MDNVSNNLLLKDLKVSTRVMNLASDLTGKSYEGVTLSDFCAYSEMDLICCRRIGFKTIKEVKILLDKFGLSLKFCSLGEVNKNRSVVYNLKKLYDKETYPYQIKKVPQQKKITYSEKSWKLFFEKIEVFKKEQGHCNVPRDYFDKWLAQKVSVTRQAYKKKKLSQILIDKLNKLGFVWVLWDESWNLFFDRLEEFKSVYGHCNVPDSYSDKWLVQRVSYVRYNNRKKLLKQDIIDKLNDIGFTWTFFNYDYSWDQFYVKLIEFKKEHGHCNVTRSYDKWLANKVNYVRKAYKAGRLLKKNIIMLTEMGFIFSFTQDVSYKGKKVINETRNSKGKENTGATY